MDTQASRKARHPMQTLAQPAQLTETDRLRAENEALRRKLAAIRRGLLADEELAAMVHPSLRPPARERAALAWHLPEGA